jgi:hypothetical protein
MNRTTRALLVAIGITGSGLAQANMPPGEGLTVCAGVYGTLQAYATDPGAKENLKNHAMRIMQAALKYNPQASQQAIALMKDNTARINRNEPGSFNEVSNAERNCRSYIKQYGL